MQNNIQIEILVARFFAGEASPDEAMQLEDWVKEAPENKSYFASCSKLFTISAGTKEGNLPAWEKIKKGIDSDNALPKASVIKLPWTRIAASIVLIIAIGFLINSPFKKTNNKIIYQAGVSSKKILLKDSSEIIIYPNSSIMTDKDYEITDRKVKLNGSAYFSVMHNPVRPFIVDVNRLYVKDPGSVFSVITSVTKDTVFINVREGNISVYDNFGSLENVAAGEKMIYIKSQQKLRVFHISHVKGNAVYDTIVPKAKPADINAEFKNGKTNVPASGVDANVKKSANTNTANTDTLHPLKTSIAPLRKTNLNIHKKKPVEIIADTIKPRKKIIEH